MRGNEYLMRAFTTTPLRFLGAFKWVVNPVAAVISKGNSEGHSPNTGLYRRCGKLQDYSRVFFLCSRIFAGFRSLHICGGNGILELRCLYLCDKRSF